MTIIDLLERNAKKYPRDTALVELNPIPDEAKNLAWKEYDLVETGHSTHYRKDLSWEGFRNLATYFSLLLKKQGVKKGGKVAILLMNSIDWLPIYFGALKAGAIVVPLNFRYTEEEIEYCLGLSDASILVFGPEFRERIDNIRGRLKKIKSFVYLGEDCPKYAASFEAEIFDIAEKTNIEKLPTRLFPKLTEDDHAAIYFSSGTTGFPKAILHKHRALLHAAKTEQKHHSQTKDDVFVLLPPLYHTGAKMHWFGSLISASKAIILKGIDPVWILETCASERATIIWLLVPWASDILDALKKNKGLLKKYDLSSLRLMHIGAQPVPPAIVKRWLKIFPKQQYDTDYGLSESIGPGCVHLGVENLRKLGAIGRAGYGWQTKVIAPDGGKTPRGEIGELCVKGPGVMEKYYKNAKATAETLRGGWLLTGDMVREDEDGFIHIVDRKKDVVITGGENIYPVQVEDFFHKSPLVKDIAVIGVPDARLGEIAIAIVSLSEGATHARRELEKFALGLPRYKRPREIIFGDVPRNPTGKIEKVKLREKYS